jgi:hypothetical protein
MELRQALLAHLLPAQAAAVAAQIVQEELAEQAAVEMGKGTTARGTPELLIQEAAAVAVAGMLVAPAVMAAPASSSSVTE